MDKKSEKEPIYEKHPFLTEPLPEAFLIRKREKEGKPITSVFTEKPIWVRSHKRGNSKVSGHYRRRKQ